MPLIILTGHPSSGLSTRAHQLSTLLSQIQSSLPASPSTPSYKITIIPSHTRAYPRTVYDNARSEKEARAVVYGRVRRALGRDTIVIVDGMNYIKGWRYQLWCEAKAAATTCCVVHVGTPEGICVENNQARIRRQKGEREKGKGDQNNADEGETGQTSDGEDESSDDPSQPYPPSLLENLIFRYEEPSTSSRWDKPLFTVPWEDKEPPADDIWEALTGLKLPKKDKPSLGSVLDTTADNNAETSTAAGSEWKEGTAKTTGGVTTGSAVRRIRPKVVPHQATMAPQTTDPNTLYALEKRTSEVVSAIRNYTLANPTAPRSLDTITGTDDAGNGLSIPIEGVETPLFIPLATLSASPTEELAGVGGVLALPKLQRLRRQWVGLNRAVVGGGHGRATGMVKDPEQVKEAFVRFLNAEFEGVDVVTTQDGW